MLVYRIIVIINILDGLFFIVVDVRVMSCHDMLCHMILCHFVYVISCFMCTWLGWMIIRVREEEVCC